MGADYKLPGYLLALVEESTTLTVGLGGDQVGYYVPVDEYRLACLDLVLPGGASCADLAARGVIEDPTWIGDAPARISPMIPPPSRHWAPMPMPWQPFAATARAWAASWANRRITTRRPTPPAGI